MTDYACKKLSLAVMVREHHNNPIPAKELENPQKPTFYDGLRPAISSLVTAEYNNKVNIWKLAWAAWNAEVLLAQDCPGEAKSLLHQQQGPDKDQEQDHACQADANFMQQHMQWNNGEELSLKHAG